MTDVLSQAANFAIKISAIVLMKSITSVFVFILAASFSLGTQLPENGSPPADTKIPQAASGNPGMYYNSYASVRAISKSIPNVRYSQG